MIPELDVQAVSGLLESGTPLRLIDCREEDEFEFCRIKGAELIPLSRFTVEVPQRLPDKSAKIVVYCHHGGRSARAVDYLIRQGYTGVSNMTGGIDAWSAQVDSTVARY